MKAIILVDKMPHNCDECSFNDTDSIGYYCKVSGNEEYTLEWGIPSWCPLRLIPQKREEEFITTFGTKGWDTIAFGWNKCIDEIVGTQECASCEEYKKWDGEDVGWCEAGKGVVDGNSVCTRIVRKEK